MKAKSKRFFFVSVVVLLTAFATTLAVVASGLESVSSATPPPPPTPTTYPPPPTVTPPVLRLDKLTVVTQEQAIDRALYYDSAWTIRDQPLTKERVAANPDMITVEEYATRQEADEVYGGGILNEPVSPPVWVVIIKGKVSVRVIGVDVPRESDGVTYFISKVDGSLIGWWEGIAQKQSERSP